MSIKRYPRLIFPVTIHLPGAVLEAEAAEVPHIRQAGDIRMAEAAGSSRKQVVSFCMEIKYIAVIYLVIMTNIYGSFLLITV